MQGDEKLRRWLDKTIITTSDGSHAQAWKAMSEDCPAHTLRIVEPPSHAGLRYNCHAFALRVNDEPKYQRLVTEHSYDNVIFSTLVSSEFVEHLIAIGELKSRRSRAFQLGDIVLHKRGGRAVHSSRVVMAGQLLQSKWGTREVHEHGLWEVPTNYGNATMVMTPPNPARVLTLLDTYLVTHPPKKT